MTVDILDQSPLKRLLSCLFRKPLAEGPALGLDFLALPEGACDVLVPSRFPGVASGKPLAPWKLVEDPDTLPHLPAPPGFELKGKARGKGAHRAVKGKANGIASFSNQKGRGRAKGDSAFQRSQALARWRLGALTWRRTRCQNLGASLPRS
ncbi:unnamed protein product [Effrenium voratum]|nr:unnamed protein product [Effrenium voratum]